MSAAPEFPYGDAEISYLKRRSPRLAVVIDRIGHISRPVDRDLFTATVRQIIGQQISNAALATVWRRLTALLGPVTAERMLQCPPADLQACGLSFRKVAYLTDFARRIRDGSFDLDALRDLPDAEIVARLTAVRGIGVWTAEMLLLFGLQRPDVFSSADLAVQRGLRMIYHHRRISRERFEFYRRRFSPYGSVASLYLWAVAGGALPDYRDHAPAAR